MRKEVARPDGCVYGAQRWIPPLTQRLGHALSGTAENVDNVSNETVQWTLTDHVNALTAHWTDQLNTVRDISARHNPGYCQLRPTNAWQRGPKAGQPRLGGGKGATTVVNHLIYDAFGQVTSETNAATGNVFFFKN